jgi:hypothetical protein
LFAAPIEIKRGVNHKKRDLARIPQLASMLHGESPALRSLAAQASDFPKGLIGAAWLRRILSRDLKMSAIWCNMVQFSAI